MTPHERTSAAALLTIIVALLIVGLVSDTILRHVVQVLPVVAATVVVVLRPYWSRFAAMPVFTFWLFIMVNCPVTTFERSGIKRAGISAQNFQGHDAERWRRTRNAQSAAASKRCRHHVGADYVVATAIIGDGNADDGVGGRRRLLRA